MSDHKEAVVRRCFTAAYLEPSWTFFAEHLEKTASDCNSINSSEKKSANKTLNYDTEIKPRQFELEVWVMKVNPGEKFKSCF